MPTACLFWDLFNFFDSEAIAEFLLVLQPHLHAGSVAHGFAVHNLKSPQGGQLYGIKELDAFNVRSRKTTLPGYSPHPQSKLKTMLKCFNFDRSVLLPDGRLELLLSARYVDDQSDNKANTVYDGTINDLGPFSNPYTPLEDYFLDLSLTHT